jgi:hypothetical protein
MARAEGAGRSTDQAAAEARRRAAEEARRRAAEARERARKAAEEARKRQQEAQQARERAERAQAAAREKQKELKVSKPKDKPRLQNELRERQTRSENLKTKATDAENRAKEARDEANRLGNEAIDSEKAANTGATAAGKKKPFAIADRVDDVYDAGSLKAEDQKKLFGTKSVVKPEEAAAHDATKIQRATELGPDKGAKALETELENNRDPAYQRALIDKSKGSVSEMGKRLAEDSTIDDEKMKSTVKSLSRASELSGDDGRRQIAGAFAKDLPSDLGTQDCGRVGAAMKEVAKEPEGARFGGAVAESLTESGKYDAAEMISKQSPELREQAKLNAGEREARDSVRVNAEDTRNEREGLLKDRETIDRDTKKNVDDVFERAKKDDLPKGVEASIEGDRAEIVQRDERGRVVAREVAVRDGEHLTYQQTQFDKGKAQRQTFDTLGDEGTIVRRESWNEKKSKNPSDPTTEELTSRASSGEKGIEVAEQSVRTDGENVRHSESLINDKGRQSSESTYRTQTGGDGIHEVPEEDFDTEQSIEVVETSRTTQKWGEEEKKSNEWTYAQGNVRATAVDSEDDETPKTWKLEKQDGNEYKSQTFVEDAPDFTTVTTRKAEGNKVTESVKSRGLNEDGDPIDSSSNSETTFAKDGTIAKKHVEAEDEKGIKTVQDYERDAKRTDRGVEVTEHFETKRTEPGEPPKVYEQDRLQKSLDKGDGEDELLSVKETLKQPGKNGQDVAVTEMDKNGMRLTVNGKAVPLDEDSVALEKLDESQKDLASQATADTLGAVKDWVSVGKGASDLLRIGVNSDGPFYQSRLPRDTQDAMNYRVAQLRGRLDGRFGSSRIDTALDVSNKIGARAQGAVGIAGLVTSGLSFAHDLQHFNGAKLALDAGSGAVSAAGTVAAAKELKAIRGGASAERASQVAGKFGSFAKFGGLGVGTAVSGYQVYEGIKGGDGAKVAQGGVGLVGTVGAFAAAGAIGGLPGAAAGVAIGLATVGVQMAIGAIWKSEPKVAEKEI